MRVERRRIPINDLSTSWVAKEPEVAAAVQRVLRSGHYLGGPETAGLECELAQRERRKHCIAVSSGMAALEAALNALDCRQGDVVVCAPNAGAYASIAAARSGCRVVLADVDPNSHLLDLDRLRDLRELRPVCIIATNLYGNVLHADGLADIAREWDAAIIEDCAQSLGAPPRAWPESVRQVSTYSFYPTKNLGGAGDAGAIATDHAWIAERLTAYRQYGWRERYRIGTHLGTNARIDELHAAILRVGLDRMSQLVERRRAIMGLYAASCGDRILAVTRSDRTSAPHLAVFMARDSQDRDRVRAQLSAMGIDTDIHYPVLDRDQEGLRGLFVESEIPVATDVVERIFTVPMFPAMPEDESMRVAQALSEINRE